LPSSIFLYLRSLIATLTGLGLRLRRSSINIVRPALKTNIRLAAAVLIVAGLFVTAHYFPVERWTSSFIGWVRDLGTFGALVYSLAYVVGTVLLFPGTLLTVGSGFLYGLFMGVVLVSPASVLGATIAFLLARSFAGDWVRKQVSKYPRFEIIDRAVEKNGFRVVLLMRLEPVFIPFALLNYALGLTRVRLRDYVLASWIGMLPATTLYVYLGSSVQSITELTHGKLPSASRWHEFLFWSGLAVAALLVFALTRIARQALQAELDPDSRGGGNGVA
jgi:uncharacterized membrane protein YdjX (TVP38/TMEM64 family)